MKIKLTQKLSFFMLVIFQLSSCVQTSEEIKESNLKIDANKGVGIGEKSAKDEFENEIFKIIRAFAKRDQKTLNSYVDRNIGIYLVPGPGTLLHFERLDSIDFSNSYVTYHQFVKKVENEYRINYENLPTFDCESFTWNKYGLFVANEYGSILTGIIENPQNAVEGKIYSEDEIKTIRNIDKITKSIILTQKDGDVHFGLAKLNGKYIITFLDIHESYCDI